MEQTTEEKTIKIPLTIFESAESKEELEDWLMTHDPVFIEEMRHLRSAAVSGQGRPLAEVAKKWNIKL